MISLTVRNLQMKPALRRCSINNYIQETNLHLILTPCNGNDSGVYIIVALCWHGAGEVTKLWYGTSVPTLTQHWHWHSYPGLEMIMCEPHTDTMVPAYMASINTGLCRQLFTFFWFTNNHWSFINIDSNTVFLEVCHLT